MSTARELADALYETPLSPDEFERRVAEIRARAAGDEGGEVMETIAWFLRRYPTPLERLAYVRRKQREGERFRGVATKGQARGDE